MLFKVSHFPIGEDVDLFDLDDDSDEEVRFVGFFSTRELAAAAIARARSKLGFRDWPGGFRVDPAELGAEWLDEGFYDPATDPDWPRE